MTILPAGHPFLEVLRAKGARFNENHDPDNGEFTSGDGGGSGGGSGSLYSDVGSKTGTKQSVEKAGKTAAGSGNGGGKTGAASGGAGNGSGRGSPRAYEGKSPRNAAGSGRLKGASIARVYAPTKEHQDAVGESGHAALSFNELNHDAGGAKVFHTLIAEAKGSNKYGAAVTLYPEEDYQHTRLFITDDGSVGFALKGDDIISVFKREGAPRGAVASVLPLAVQEGGRRLDCFDTQLPRLYAQSGFVATDRVKFDDEFAPDGWDKETFKEFNGGSPDIVFMRYDPANAGYKLGDGKMHASYDEAMAAQKAAVHAAEPAASNLFDKYHDSSASAEDIERSVPGASVAVGEAERKLKDSTPTNAPVSKGGFIRPDGTYTPEREALHQQILSELFSPAAVAAATPAAGEKPIMTLLGGRGGSGKSWFTKQGIADASHAIYINADDVQAKLPGYEGWNAAAYHDEASDITKHADDIARQLGLSVIHDATMRTPGGSAKRVAEYKAAGYAVHGHYMFLPPQTSTKRALERFVRGGKDGRYVPASYLLNSTTNERTFDSLKGQFDKWTIYENTGASPKLVAASDQEKRNGRHSTRQVRERSRSAGGRRSAVHAGVSGVAPQDGREAEGSAERLIARKRAFDPITAYTRQLFERETRYNENHDPDNGEFTSGPGGSGSGGSVAPTETVATATPAKTEPALNPQATDVAGDGWNKETAVRLEREYQTSKSSLDDIVQTGVGADVEHADDDEDNEDQPSVPEEWDMLSSDQQEEVKTAYVKANLDSWIESEHNNYYDSGDALDDAKRVLAEGFNDLDGSEDWARDALEEWLADRADDEKPVPYTLDQLLSAISVKYQDGYEGNGKFEIDFDSEKLSKPSTLVEGQELLPGIEEIHPSSALSIQMRDEIEELLTKEFDKAAEKKSSSMDPPDYLTESAQENVEEEFDHNFDDDSKFNWAKNHTDIVSDAQAEADQWSEEHHSSGVVADPSTFKVDPLNETSGSDYKKTQALATYLSFERQKQIIKDRKLTDLAATSPLHNEVDDETIRRIDKQIWEAWKNSSTSFAGRVLQLATAEELGGRFREFKGNQPGPDGMPVTSHRTDMIKQANDKFAAIGGFDGVKALVRAKWETSQYLLDKAGIHTLEVYRGMKVDLPANEKQDLVHPVNGYGQGKPYIRITDTKLLRNGAWSTTTDRSVANNWNAGSGDKIVLRIDAPRTAVISFPAYGVNVHSEKEVVLAGTAYKTWDAWKGSAPSFTEIPVGTPATKSMVDGKVEKIAA